MRRPTGTTLLALVLAAPLAIFAGCSELDVRPGAESIFEAFAPPSPEEAARMAIDPYDADARYKGTLLLANASFAGEPIYLTLFRDNINDDDPGVRSASIRALANHGTPDDVALILPSLDDADPAVRLEAAQALQRLHNPVAVEPLLLHIQSERETESAVRAAAAEALGQYAQTNVVQRLIAAFEDPSLAVNRATLDSLRTLTGQDFGFDRRAWLQWYNASDQVFAARSMYIYPVFYRGKKWYEHIPLFPPPPNEQPAAPTGLRAEMMPAS